MSESRIWLIWSDHTLISSSTRKLTADRRRITPGEARHTLATGGSASSNDVVAIKFNSRIFVGTTFYADFFKGTFASCCCLVSMIPIMTHVLIMNDYLILNEVNHSFIKAIQYRLQKLFIRSWTTNSGICCHCFALLILNCYRLRPKK